MLTVRGVNRRIRRRRVQLSEETGAGGVELQFFPRLFVASGDSIAAS